MNNIQALFSDPQFVRHLLEILVLLFVTTILTWLIVRAGWKRRLRKEKARYDELQVKYDQLQTEKDELSNTYNKLVGEKQQIAAKLERAEGSSKDLQLQIDNLQPYKIRYETVKVNYDRSKEQVAALEDHIRTLEEKEQVMSIELEEAREKAENALTQVQTIKDEQREAAANARKEKVDEVKNRFSSIFSKPDSTTDVIDEAVAAEKQQATADINEAIDDAADKMSIQTTEVEEDEGVIADLKEDVSEAAENIKDGTESTFGKFKSKLSSWFAAPKKEAEEVVEEVAEDIKEATDDKDA